MKNKILSTVKRKNSIHSMVRPKRKHVEEVRYSNLMVGFTVKEVRS